MITKKQISVILIAMLLIAALIPTAAFAANTAVNVSLPVQKVLKGSTPSTRSNFSFKLASEDADNPMPETDVLVINGDGSGTFEAMTFTEPGDYKYTVTEVDGKATYYTYDKTEYTVTVQVTTDNTGVLSAKVSVADQDGKKSADGIVFTNNYSVPSTNNPGTPKTADETHNSLLLTIVIISTLGMLILALSERTGNRQERRKANNR